MHITPSETCTSVENRPPSNKHLPELIPVSIMTLSKVFYSDSEEVPSDAGANLVNLLFDFATCSGERVISFNWVDHRVVPADNKGALESEDNGHRGLNCVPYTSLQSTHMRVNTTRSQTEPAIPYPHRAYCTI
jgi:hypothetical protein